MAVRGALLTISPLDWRHTRPSTAERSAPQDLAANQSHTVYSYSRTATASTTGDISKVSLGRAETCRPTSRIWSEGLAATRDSTTLTSLRMLGVEVSQTTASMFLAVMRSITSCTE